jgi:hypothetical protein
MQLVACRNSTSGGPPANVDVAIEFPSLTIGLCLAGPCVPEASEAVALVVDASGNYLTNDVAWSSSNPTVASVVSTGTGKASVKPLAKGTATITATVVGTNPPISGSAPVTVKLGGVLDVQLSLGANTLSTGQTTDITVTARNSGEGPISLEGPSDCLLAIRILNGAGTVVYNTDRNCAGATISAQLGGGQQRVQAFAWDGRSNAGVRVPPGSYTIEGVVRLASNPLTSQPGSIAVQ